MLYSIDNYCIVSCFNYFTMSSIIRRHNSSASRSKATAEPNRNSFSTATTISRHNSTASRRSSSTTTSKQSSTPSFRSQKGSPYHRGINGDGETFELNIEVGKFARSRLYRAIKSANSHKVLTSIQLGEDVTCSDEEFQSTYLHLVVGEAHPLNEEKLLPMIYQLSNAGVDVHARDYKGRSALELAVTRNLSQMIAALIRVGINPEECNYSQIIEQQSSPFQLEMEGTLDKYSPGLWCAVDQNDMGMVHVLLNSWCRVNIHKDDCSLIEYAKVQRKSPELITTLEDFEVTLEFVHATLAGDEKRMLELLMDTKPCDPSVMDISHQDTWSQPLTPRSLRDTAISMGHKHVLHLLPEDEEQDKMTQEVNDSSTIEATLPTKSYMHPEYVICAVRPGQHSEQDSEPTESVVDFDMASEISGRDMPSMTSECKSLTSGSSQSSHTHARNTSVSTITSLRLNSDQEWREEVEEDDIVIGNYNYFLTANGTAPSVAKFSPSAQVVYNPQDYTKNWKKQSKRGKKPSKHKSIGPNSKSKTCVIS